MILNTLRRLRLRTLISLGLILVLLPVVIISLYKPSESQAVWYSENYAYRQKFSFTHNASITSPRAITVTFDNAEMITAGAMQADCDDVRFTDINGKQLYHDLTSSCNNASATYEVIFNEILNGINTGYIYYGNPSATNAEIDSTVFTALTPSGGDPSAITNRNNEEDSPGPVAYWSFDEGVDNTCAGGANDACDGSTNVLDMDRNNNTAWTNEDMCLSGKCFFFDGTNDHISRSEDDSLLDFAATDAFTLQVWVRIPPSHSGTDQLINDDDNDGTDGDISLNMQSDGNFRFAWDDDDADATSENVETTAGTYADNQWHLVTAIKDGTTAAYIYIDGVLVATDSSITETGTLANNDGYALGTELDGTTNDFLGFMDEVKIYNYARSASQVKSDFNARGSSVGTAVNLGQSETKGTLSDGLLAYWPMNEVTANTCTGGANDNCDFSGNSTDIAWNNNATSTTGGKFSAATTYDGTDDYASCTDADCGGTSKLDFGAGAAITWGAWVKTSSSNTQVIVGKKQSTSTTAAGYLAYLNSSGQLSCKYGDGTDDKTLSSNTSVNDGAWHHVFCAADGTNMGTYVDGKQETTISLVSITGSLDNAEDFRIGTTGNGNNDFTGQIDEVRVYEKGLPGNDIAYLHNWGPSPIGYWPLNENAGTSTTFDRSGNAYNGSMNGTMTEDDWVAGRFGAGLDLDGSDDEVAVSDGANFSINSYSMMSWVYAKSDPEAEAYVIGNQDASNDGTRLIFDASGSNDITCGYNSTDVSGGLISLNTWTHLACTSDGSTMRLYINGILVNSVSISGSISETTNATLGGRSHTTGNNFPGIIDDARVYNYPRTPDQIVEDMNAGHPVGGSPIGSQAAYWALDEGYGTTANNSVSSTPVGTIAGSTWNTGSNCKINTCLSFDGSDDNADFTDSTVLEFADGSDFSLSTWIFTSGDTGALIAKKNATSNTNSGYMITVTSAGVISFYASDGTDQYQLDTGSSAFPNNAWNHIVVVYDDDSTTNTAIYVNGNKVATTPSGTLSSVNNVGVNSNAFNIASESDDQAFFAGRMDEVKVYSSALSASEVMIDMNANAAINFGAGTVESAQLTDGALPEPVSYFDFNEKTGTTAFDKGSGKTNGTLTGSMTQDDWVQGKSGTALDLDGSNDYVDVGTGPGTVRTVSFWVKPTTTSEHFIDLDGSNFISSSSGTVSATGFTSPTIYINGVVGTTITANTWYHVTVTTATAENASDLDLGRLEGTDNLSGMLDEVKIYSTALTQSQVAYDYNRGRPLAHWQQDECQGTTASDASGNGFNGTISIGSGGANTDEGTCSGASGEAWFAGVSGKINSAVDLDGTDDFINIYSAALAGAFNESQGTVTAWLKLDSADWTDGDNDFVVQLRGDNTSLVRIYNNTTNNQLQLQYLTPTTDDSVLYTSAGGNIWYHVAGTWSTTTNQIEFFVNGNSVGTSSGLGTWATDLNSASTVIGAQNTTPNGPFDGQVDDVRIYNYPLSASQIKKIINDDSGARFGPSEGQP